MFWLGHKLGCEATLLVSLDLTLEVFTSIPLPFIEHFQIYMSRPTIFENQFAILSRNIEEYVMFWVLED